jgi:hypothetical protein
MEEEFEEEDDDEDDDEEPIFLGRATAPTSTANTAALERDNKRVWSWQDKKLLVACVKANGPCRRAFMDFIRRTQSRHNGPKYPLDERGSKLVKAYWSRLLKEFKERETWVRPWKVSPADHKVILVLVGPRATDQHKSRAWKIECDTQEEEWALVRNVALEAAQREILDDTDSPRTAQEVRDKINSSKEARKVSREESFRLLQQDAQRSTELKEAQLKAFNGMETAITSFVQSNQAILQLLTRIMMTPMVPDANIRNPDGLARVAAPESLLQDAAPASVPLQVDVATAPHQSISASVQDQLGIDPETESILQEYSPDRI